MKTLYTDLEDVANIWEVVLRSLFEGKPAMAFFRNETLYVRIRPGFWLEEPHVENLTEANMLRDLLDIQEAVWPIDKFDSLKANLRSPLTCGERTIFSSGPIIIGHWEDEFAKVTNKSGQTIGLEKGQLEQLMLEGVIVIKGVASPNKSKE